MGWFSVQTGTMIYVPMRCQWPLSKNHNSAQSELVPVVDNGDRYNVCYDSQYSTFGTFFFPLFYANVVTYPDNGLANGLAKSW